MCIYLRLEMWLCRYYVLLHMFLTICISGFRYPSRMLSVMIVAVIVVYQVLYQLSSCAITAFVELIIHQRSSKLNINSGLLEKTYFICLILYKNKSLSLGTFSIAVIINIHFAAILMLF